MLKIAVFVASVLSGLVGVAAALINSAALKIAGLGVMTAKAKIASAAAKAKAAAEAGVKAVLHQAKSKIAVAPDVAHVAPVAPVVAAPTVPVVPSVTSAKIVTTPLVITGRPVPVDPCKLTAALPTGLDNSMTYGHPFFGCGFTRSAITLLKHREASLTNAAINLAVGMNPQVLKNIFEYVTSYDAERCVQRAVCEVAAQPSLAGPQGKNVTEFMTSLPKDDSGAPWMPYREATVTGQVSADRSQCQERYPSCSPSTETLVQMARTTIAQGSESVTSVTGAATVV